MLKLKLWSAALCAVGLLLVASGCGATDAIRTASSAASMEVKNAASLDTEAVPKENSSVDFTEKEDTDSAGEEIVVQDASGTADEQVDSTASAAAGNTPKAKSSHTETQTADSRQTSGNKAVSTPNTNSGNKTSGSSNSTSANTATGESTKAEHTHSWQPVYKTVHHDEVGHTETVTVQEAYDEPIYEEREVCSACGKTLAPGTDTDLHILDDHNSQASYSVQNVQVGTKHHDAVTEQKYVVDQAAYDEQVISGYQCSCGATK